MDARYNALFIGKVRKEYGIIDSTNNEMEHLLKVGSCPEGLVITAMEQTAGRGQMGNKWSSEAGKNLTMSLLLYPKIIIPTEQFLLNQLVSLAVRDTLIEMGLRKVEVKWPNDVLVQEKKMAGILIQNSLSGKKISSCIVGIGLNINQKSFPSELKKATSFFLEKGKEISLELVLDILCSCLEKRYLELKSGKKTKLHSDYHEFLFKKNRDAFFKKKDGIIFKGKIIGVDESGRLKIKTQERIEIFYFKEISFV